MIHYRTFRNTDPPGLVEVWNAAFTGRGTVHFDSCLWLEFFLLSKPYFDPESLIIAQADRQIVGFAWVGFGPNASANSLDPNSGVICLLGVAPSYRRQGIGSELLRRAETYLRSHGSQKLFAGPMSPLNPYTFGLYGGSNSPGFLDSDSLAHPFFTCHGYTVENSCLVFQRPLDCPLHIADSRFAAHRLRYEHCSHLFRRMTWWQECVFGPVELYEYRLQDKRTGHVVAHALLWDMETYVSSWNQRAVGIIELFVCHQMRRQGLAKFLLTGMLRYLQDQFFDLAEMQLRADNLAGINLLRSLSFEQVDTGHLYRK